MILKSEETDLSFLGSDSQQCKRKRKNIKSCFTFQHLKQVSCKLAKNKQTNKKYFSKKKKSFPVAKKTNSHYWSKQNRVNIGDLKHKLELSEGFPETAAPAKKEILLDLGVHQPCSHCSPSPSARLSR